MSKKKLEAIEPSLNESPSKELSIKEEVEQRWHALRIGIGDEIENVLSTMEGIPEPSKEQTIELTFLMQLENVVLEHFINPLDDTKYD